MQRLDQLDRCSHHVFKVIHKAQATDKLDTFIVTLECVLCTHVEVKREQNDS